MTTPAPKAQGRQRRPRKFYSEKFSRNFCPEFITENFDRKLCNVHRNSTKNNNFFNKNYTNENHPTQTRISTLVFCALRQAHTCCRVIPFASYLSFLFPFGSPLFPSVSTAPNLVFPYHRVLRVGKSLACRRGPSLLSSRTSVAAIDSEAHP